MKLSDSQWYKQLSKSPADSDEERGIYWLWPFKNYKTFCPYLFRSRVIPPGAESIHYRTGDRACRPMADGPLRFRGGLDHQIKVQGYRVELQEIEAMVNQEAGVDLAIAVGWPLRAASAAGIEAFITSPFVDLGVLRERLRARLPRYAVPRRIHVVERWPLNSNGKIDRGQLLKLLETRL